VFTSLQLAPGWEVAEGCADVVTFSALTLAFGSSRDFNHKSVHVGVAILLRDRRTVTVGTSHGVRRQFRGRASIQVTPSGLCGAGHAIARRVEQAHSTKEMLHHFRWQSIYSLTHL
jgi:hypothetical protein